ncbi:sigma-54 dependent transcriptional regulator [Methylobacterium sp. E-041]|jgi:DNA-binding NtrC family response regulator|uniref:sigma-54-dependent transcriptional regulator FlbD n=1 Tax=unclassified Methylobacterium TaxID=2615210 RepID=UPI0011C721E9|nr:MULTISPECIES: sigma-54 dependent transcriptional regulator [unclassified Methylobacterium]MCJ2009665.1 sigma-54 dependent transcriptional regulator [Methylobacterium sp. J-092]MCJ2040320.1 sigma-54 dependent transcriptional regulator [Methylobacterium sp. J-059]MCJ2106187.1 sigma-54 dependent transcriptional regulator [Methylobacterium sp. E-041]MCJ2111836.1 sigma-54 dependent transcriptional regulator [Methylobacterium sp. E-025]TXM92707.1 sigma-54-dependent Fis family transcriptional regu
MRLLIIGRLNGELITASKIAMNRGAAVTQADGVAQGLNVLRAKGADLIMIDVGLSIRDLVAALSEERIRTPVVACGVTTDAKAAVAAIQAGAKEYIPLPPDPDLIAAVLEAVSADGRAFVWRDASMEKVVRLAEQIARSEASVLITGESGTGKEVLARHVHQKSARGNKPFVSVNCAAIPEALLESELFGHEKGAFTGAVARRIGRFEEANGGTLLLDEISEMDVRLQSKLLRALQERVIDRVGGSAPVKVDIRVLATSNRNLAEEVRKGTFREDLFYRLNVVHLRLPPLRERPADILELAAHFAKKYAEVNGVPVRPLGRAAQEMVLKNPWRGNVRELENTLHRAVLLASGPEIGADAILTPEGDSIAAPVGAATRAAQVAEAATRGLVGRTVAQVECDLILDTLDHCLGNRTHAAKILGISIRTLRNKLNEYVGSGLEVAEPGSARAIAAYG